VPVLLGVYYESLCPDSADFIVHKLQPVYNKLSDVLFLELVPYGNAKVCDDKWQYTYVHVVQYCKMHQNEQFFTYCDTTGTEKTLSPNCIRNS